MYCTLATAPASAAACMGPDGVMAMLPGGALPGVREGRTEQRKGGSARARMSRGRALRPRSRGRRAGGALRGAERHRAPGRAIRRGLLC